MSNENIRKRLQGFLAMQAEGCCTNAEVVYATVQLLGDESIIEAELWLSLPEWVQDDVIKVLRDFEPNKEFCLPAHSESVDVVRRRFTSLKSWLLKNEFMKI